MPTIVYDLEIYPNFFLAVFKEATERGDGPVRKFTWDDREQLGAYVDQQDLTLVGYNNHEFDDSILAGVITGRINSLDALFDATQALIARDYEIEWLPQLKKLSRSWITVDLMQILGGPARAGSLKAHQVRLGMLNVQDIPIEPGTELNDAEKETITAYCENDVSATERLYYDVFETIQVRHRSEK